jgi:hypothetical protein
MKNLVKNFNTFINEGYHFADKKSNCCGAEIIEEDSTCSDCGQMAEMNYLESSDLDDSDLYGDIVSFESKKSGRKAVLKAASEKYPNLSPSKMKKTLGKMKDSDFKEKAKKYFSWADDPEAAAAAFIRKATGKEPRNA